MSRTRFRLRWLISPARRRTQSFARDERGVTVIEFALLALPFFTIIAAILETSLVFLAGQILESAVQDSSRLIRTGQAQAASYNAANFRTAICNGLYGMFNCANLRIKVSVVSNFSSATTSYPLPTGTSCTATSCDWTLAESYAPGVGGDVVLVQAYYKWPTVVHLPGFDMQDQPDGTRLLGAVRVFKNEPF